MGLLSVHGSAPLSPKEAAEKMEALLLQQMLSSAHLFGKSDSPGASLRGDLFSEALAEAVAKSGGVGIAKLFEPKADPASPHVASAEQVPLIGSDGSAEAQGEAPSDPRHV
jgi:Rod binding domain-containing protein